MLAHAGKAAAGAYSGRLRFQLGDEWRQARPSQRLGDGSAVPTCRQLACDQGKAAAGMQLYVGAACSEGLARRRRASCHSNEQLDELSFNVQAGGVRLKTAAGVLCTACAAHERLPPSPITPHHTPVTGMGPPSVGSDTKRFLFCSVSKTSARSMIRRSEALVLRCVSTCTLFAASATTLPAKGLQYAASLLLSNYGWGDEATGRNGYAAC